MVRTAALTQHVKCRLFIFLDFGVAAGGRWRVHWLERIEDVENRAARWTSQMGGPSGPGSDRAVCRQPSQGSPAQEMRSGCGQSSSLQWSFGHQDAFLMHEYLIKQVIWEGP